MTFLSRVIHFDFSLSRINIKNPENVKKNQLDLLKKVLNVYSNQNLLKFLRETESIILSADNIQQIQGFSNNANPSIILLQNHLIDFGYDKDYQPVFNILTEGKFETWDTVCLCLYYILIKIYIHIYLLLYKINIYLLIVNCHNRKHQ